MMTYWACELGPIRWQTMGLACIIIGLYFLSGKLELSVVHSWACFANCQI